MRFAYADPPYPGQSAKHYSEHPDYAGEVDHAELIASLASFDGWALHTSAPALRDLLPLCPPEARVLAWVKPFCAFKRNVSLAHAWEPVILLPLRRANVEGAEIMRDWIAEPITMRRGLAGAKPARVCRWIFDAAGLEPADELADLFPGSGAVSEAWAAWQMQAKLPMAEKSESAPQDALAIPDLGADQSAA